MFYKNNFVVITFLLLASFGVCADENGSEINLGYLKGTIKTFDGAGCTYILLQDDKKKGKKNSIAETDFEYKGMVVNLNGNDALVLGSNRRNGFSGVFEGVKVKIPTGKQQSCGVECVKEITTIQFNKGNVIKSVAVVAYCGS